MFGTAEKEAAEHLIARGLEEDLSTIGDQTCQSLVSEDETGLVVIRSRESGVLAGLPCAAAVFQILDAEVGFHSLAEDGQSIEPGEVVAEIEGPLRSLLVGERTALNLLNHLCGVATLTRHFVDRISDCPGIVLDTRKTLPGYRVLQKYAVRCGGGSNHRMGLFDGILIKDNHLAAWTSRRGDSTIAAAVEAARSYAAMNEDLSVEVEVDSIEQLRDALRGRPDIVLLDNMTPAELTVAIEIRNEIAEGVLLEASGGINLETIEAVARTGVDRISVGSLTHSAVALDLGFDWSLKSTR